MKKPLAVFISVFILITIFGYTLMLSNKQPVNNIISITEDDGSVIGSSNKPVTLDELSKHSSSEGCWIMIEGNIYDMTDYISKHPGKGKILEGCGKDATELFKGGGGHIHSQAARLILRDYQIGTQSN